MQSFIPSKGWLAKFEERYSLHNISFLGEKPSADREAAQNYIPRLKDLIEEKEYLLESI